MFVPLSKTLDLLLAPLTWALLLGAGAAFAAVRARARGTAALAAAAVALLALASSGRLSGSILRLAEAGVASTARPGVTYDAVVVLSGGVDAAATEASGELELNHAAERLLAGYDLARTGRARFVLLTGGPEDAGSAMPNEAEVSAARLRAWGVDPARVVIEGRSRNTHENAVESAKVARARGWRSLLLVTSAAHMPRALGCFHAAGLRPDALPVDHRARRGGGETWFPRAKNLAEGTEALRELAGRAVYRALGYSAP